MIPPHPWDIVLTRRRVSWRNAMMQDPEAYRPHAEAREDE